MPSKALVLDANILIRAVLGQRVRRLLEFHADAISFFIPETAYAEAEEHLAALVAKRGGEPEKALRLLRSLAALGTVMTHDIYADFETEALESGWNRATRTTGRFWPQLWRLAVRSGRRTLTSSVAASLRGHPQASAASSRSSDPLPLPPGTRPSSPLTGSRSPEALLLIDRQQERFHPGRCGPDTRATSPERV
jgi:PIN domain